MKDRCHEAIRRDGQLLRHQLPSEGLGLYLEVIPKREVSKHLEEREMRVITDLIDISGAEALLDRSQARARRRRLAEEVRLEGNHSGAGEEQRRIAGRNKRRTRNFQVAVPNKVIEETTTDLAGVHACARWHPLRAPPPAHLSQYKRRSL